MGHGGNLHQTGVVQFVRRIRGAMVIQMGAGKQLYCGHIGFNKTHLIAGIQILGHNAGGYPGNVADAIKNEGPFPRRGSIQNHKGFAKQTSHRVQINHPHDVAYRVLSRVVHVILGSQQPGFFTTKSNKNNRAPWFGCFAHNPGQFQQYRHAAGVVVRTGVDFSFVSLVHIGPAAVQVVVMRPQNNRLPRPCRVCAGQNANHVFQRHVAGLPQRGHVLLPGLKIAAVIAAGLQSGFLKYPRNVLSGFFNAFASQAPAFQFRAGQKVHVGFHAFLREQGFQFRQRGFRRQFPHGHRLAAQHGAQGRMYHRPLPFDEIGRFGALKRQIAVFAIVGKFAGQAFRCCGYRIG